MTGITRNDYLKRICNVYLLVGHNLFSALCLSFLPLYLFQLIIDMREIYKQSMKWAHPSTECHSLNRTSTIVSLSVPWLFGWKQILETVVPRNKYSVLKQLSKWIKKRKQEQYYEYKTTTKKRFDGSVKCPISSGTLSSSDLFRNISVFRSLPKHYRRQSHTEIFQ